MKKLALALSLLATPASAADLPVKAKAFSITTSGCTITSCSGWYAGIGLSGDGTNANIIGNGFNGSVFAAGMGLDVHAGYQLWNGTYFAAVEAGIGNQFQPTQSISSLGNSLEGYEKVKLGIGLSGLLGGSVAPATPSQAPTAINIPSTIANTLMSPYVQIGAQQRKGISQMISGAGAEFLLASHWNLDIGYTYAPAVGTLSSENKVKLSVDYHF